MHNKAYIHMGLRYIHNLYVTRMSSADYLWLSVWA